jgi:hypothetical protein
LAELAYIQMRVEVRRPFTAAAVLRSMSKAFTSDQQGNAAKGFRLWAEAEGVLLGG